MCAVPLNAEQSLGARIAAAARQAAGDQPAVHVRIGLNYTAVLLADGSCGVAMTNPGGPGADAAGDCCSAAPRLRPLGGRPAAQLLELLESPLVVERAVGLACANALLNRPGSRDRAGDALELIDLRPQDRVGMVGCFWPMLDALRGRVSRLQIFEQIAEPDGDLLPARQAPEMLPQCQVALITATTIVNGTLEDLLRACSGCRQVVLLGASTPLAPRAFAGTPVSHLCGVQVTDAAQVLTIVSEGDGMRRFKGHVKKVCVAIAGDEPTQRGPNHDSKR